MTREGGDMQEKEGLYITHCSKTVAYIISANAYNNVMWQECYCPH